VSIEDSIDWPIFRAFTENVGDTYARVVTEHERVYFRKAFISSFSISFNASGGRFSAFTNWRVYNSDKINTVVAADTIAKRVLLLLTVSKKLGKRKLVNMQFSG
jgi:hypothetical protein